MDTERIVQFEDGVWQDGFTQMPNALLRDPEVSPQAKMLWMGLASYAWESDECFPGQERLVKELALSERTVRRATRELEEKGLLRTTRRGLGKTNRYVLLTGLIAQSGRSDRPERPVPYIEKKTKKEEVPSEIGISNQERVSGESRDSELQGEKSTPESCPLSHLLADLIEANGSKRPRVTQKWADAERRLIELDGRPRAEAEEVLRWSQADEFWRSNILSMPTFRAKYDRLRLQSQRSPQGAWSTATGESTAEFNERMDRKFG